MRFLKLNIKKKTTKEYIERLINVDTIKTIQERATGKAMILSGEEEMITEESYAYIRGLLDKEIF